MSTVKFKDEWDNEVTRNADDMLCSHCGDLFTEECGDGHGYFCGGIGEWGGHNAGVRAWVYALMQNDKHTKLEDFKLSHEEETE